jgi:sugar/nucleoside kinase (ribokinase family)
VASSSSQPAGKPASVLCAGIGVQDIVFRVPQFPPPGGKAMADDFVIVSGGCAVNAAIAVARLDGRAHYAGPLGDDSDPVSNQLMAELAREGVGTAGVVRVSGARAPVSGIMIDAAGERMIATYRDRRIEAARPANPDALVANVTVLLADNRFADFVQPICEAARRRGIPVVLDADRPTAENSPLFAIATHVVFSSECLRATTGCADLDEGLRRIAPQTQAFLAVSNGPQDALYIADGAVRRMPVFAVDAIDTLAAGDVFHAGFALALAEGRDELASLRFGAAAAALKCTRFGGSAGAPHRAEVEAFLARAG